MNSRIAISFLFSILTSWSAQGQVTRVLSPEMQRCSSNIYQRVATHESKTDYVCSLGRTDAAFQNCTVLMTHELDRVNRPQGYPDSNNVVIAGESCFYTPTFEASRCAADLYLRGGLFVFDGTGLDGSSICKSAQASQLQACIVDLYQTGRHTGKSAAKACIDQYDPVAIAKRQAEEKRRLEIQREAAARRQLEEQRRQEELRRQQEEARASAPQNNDGIIFDLPNFD